MSVMFKKAFLACVVVLMTLTTSAWQNPQIVFTEKQSQDVPATPLYSGLTWTDLGESSRDITLSVRGDSASLSGETYQAEERFSAGIPQDVSDFYSNTALAEAGWASYDTFEGSDGLHKVFYHDSGVYLSVEFTACADDPASVCVTVWKSGQAGLLSAAGSAASESASAEATFSKSSPANGATNLDPKNLTLSWETYSPAPDKYSYCIKAGEVCDENDPNWTGTYLNTSIKLTNLEYGKVYYWQVKAITCATCIPKKFVYANGGTWWTLTTKPTTGTNVSIVGNAGVGGAVLTYAVNNVTKTATADLSGGYTILVPYGWSGTVTPSKPGYFFTPPSATFTNLTAAQTVQNFLATTSNATPFEISGNAGIANAVLSYADNGVNKTALADSTGAYKFRVSPNWSGTVTPSQGSYYFTPASRTYANVVADQTAQNYTVAIFYDVPSTYWAFNSIERLYKSGITGGCSTNPLSYCPENKVTRAQMAIFLLRGIHDSAYAPPAVGSGTGFTDVPVSYWAAAWIKQFAAEGITGGCGATTYCPDSFVTQAQMAIFLLRSKHGSGYTPPAVGTSTGYADVPITYWAAAWIKQLTAEGISSGCGNGYFCPESFVTRAQMAVLMVNTFALPKQ